MTKFKEFLPAIFSMKHSCETFSKLIKDSIQNNYLKNTGRKEQLNFIFATQIECLIPRSRDYISFSDKTFPNTHTLFDDQ